MSVLILLVFVSAILVIGAVLFFVWTVREHTYDHSDRLSLLPLERDDAPRIEDSLADGTDTE
ncbi:MAG: cbb3-type cytochrome oxidase assembly protein CcoS [Myxococcales bacterium]|nr:cbb3-type cytochrome oxidase assembly protein CcoS [Myxococcales bacterium]